MSQTCQMRARIKGIIAEGRVRPGVVFWTTTERARLYIEQGVAEPNIPSETKPMEPAEKKSFVAALDGRSTDSPKSIADGPATLSSVLPADRVSTTRKSRSRSSSRSKAAPV